jgi:hypothetical protein
MHDQVALDTYFAIARELKDAYPADYNDLGKIWDAISAASKKALPFLKKVPGFSIPANLIGGVVTAGDWMRKAGKTPPPKGKGKGKGKKKKPQQKQQQKKPQAKPRAGTSQTSARQEARRRSGSV